MAEEYDVVVIGSGPGGYVAAIRAAQLKLKTACIEKMSSLGGTCLNVGCIPSKALLQTTELYTKMGKEAASQGISVKDLSYDFGVIQQRKDKVVKGLTDGVSGLFKRNQIQRIDGNARIISPTQIEVVKDQKSTIITAKNIIIATGSEPIQLPFLPFDEHKVVSSTGALALSDVPKKLVVVGGGAIGLEIASVYKRLGSEVIIVEMLDRICPTMDSAISKMILQILKKQGIEFHLSTEVQKGKIEGDTVALFIREGDKTSVLNANVVLVCVGRRPYTGGLGLKELGIKVSPKGFVEVNGEFRTNIPNIFAIGDVIDGPMLAHRASEEGVATAEIIAGLHPHINYMAVPNVIYTYPEVAAVGMTEKEARDDGLEVLIGTYSFRGNPRARCAGEEEGIVKVIGEAKTGRLIGMHIIGSHASEQIIEGVIAILQKATLEEIGNAPHPHPTLSEAVKEACLNALGRAIHL